MGAGKTTVGRLLAPMLGWRFIDTDAVLVERHGCSIAELFALHGEPQFREWEAEAVAEALAGEQVVVALGGGAVEHHYTQALLNSAPRTLTVFLKTPFSLAIKRCTGESGSVVRPILTNPGRVYDRYESRLPFYQSAHLALSTEAQTPAALAHAIAQAVLRDLS